jgi:hypothetical protein
MLAFGPYLGFRFLCYSDPWFRRLLCAGSA